MDIDTIVLGDCYKLIKEVPDKSVDLIVTAQILVGFFDK